MTVSSPCLRPFVRVAATALFMALGFVGLAQAQVNNPEPAVTTPTQAPIDINQASEAQLDSIHGVGPATTRRILEARAQAPFQDWNDLIQRVRGVGARAAARFSEQGFTVNGAAYRGTGPAPASVTSPTPVSTLKNGASEQSTSASSGASATAGTTLTPAQ